MAIIRKITKNRRAVSAVIETVLLVLIAVIGVTILSAFAIPFIRDNLSKGGVCFKVTDQLDFENSLGGVKTCYNAQSGESILIIKRGNSEDISLEGIAVLLKSEGQSKRFDIKSGNFADIKEYGKNYSAGIELLSSGTEKTYIVNYSGAKSAELSAILSGNKVCESSASVQLSPC